MRRTVLIVGALVCLAGIVAAAMAQQTFNPPASEGRADPFATGPRPSGNADPMTPRGVRGGETLRPEPLRPMVTERDKDPVAELIDQWKKAENDADREKVQKELREAVKAEFLARLAPQVEEVKQLEAKVLRLHKQLELRRSKQDEIIDFRMQQLLREAQGLGWGTETRAGRLADPMRPLPTTFGNNPTAIDPPSSSVPAQIRPAMPDQPVAPNELGELAPRPSVPTSASPPIQPVTPSRSLE